MENDPADPTTLATTKNRGTGIFTIYLRNVSCFLFCEVTNHNEVFVLVLKFRKVDITTKKEFVIELADDTSSLPCLVFGISTIHPFVSRGPY